MSAEAHRQIRQPAFCLVTSALRSDNTYWLCCRPEARIVCEEDRYDLACTYTEEALLRFGSCGGHREGTFERDSTSSSCSA
jgi:hypothetical protein